MARFGIVLAFALAIGCAQATVQHLLDEASVVAALADTAAKILMVKSDTCSHCQKFAPIFEELALKYPLKFLAVERKLAPTCLDIKGVPSFFAYHNAQPVGQCIGADREEVANLCKAVELKL